MINYGKRGGVLLLIQNIIPDFLAAYESNTDFEVSNLEAYIHRHPEVFDQYFPNHCPKTEARFQSALVQYPTKIRGIRTISERLPEVIEQNETDFSTMFSGDFNLEYKLMVGTFGSNAFVTPNNRREIYFAAEKLSSQTDHLKVIVAHEIGHVAHFSFATNQGMDWATVGWMHGLTTLYTEGAATYLSKKVVPELKESVYFTYDDDGDPWVTCYEGNKMQVKSRFFEDVLAGWDMTK